MREHYPLVLSCQSFWHHEEEEEEKEEADLMGNLVCVDRQESSRTTVASVWSFVPTLALPLSLLLLSRPLEQLPKRTGTLNRDTNCRRIKFTLENVEDCCPEAACCTAAADDAAAAAKDRKMAI